MSGHRTLNTNSKRSYNFCIVATHTIAYESNSHSCNSHVLDTDNGSITNSRASSGNDYGGDSHYGKRINMTKKIHNNCDESLPIWILHYIAAVAVPNEHPTTPLCRPLMGGVPVFRPISSLLNTSCIL